MCAVVTGFQTCALPCFVDGAGATQMLGGFSASGDSVRGVLETLAVASGGWFAPAGAHIRFTADGAPVRPNEDRGDGPGTRGGPTDVRQTAPTDPVPPRSGQRPAGEAGGRDGECRW